MPHDAINAIFAAAHAFFALPRAQRDAIKGSGVPRRLLEAFQIMLDLGPDDPDVRSGSVMHGPNVWPNDGPGFSASAFRAAMERYYDEVWRLSERLLSVFAFALRQEPDYFRPYFAKPLTQLRLLHYPPQPADAGAQGVEAHTDPGAFTILLQDSVGGLESRNRAGQWIGAPPIPYSFVINIGDMMQRWTNGRLTSTPHRVANRTGRDRIFRAILRQSGLWRDDRAGARRRRAWQDALRASGVRPLYRDGVPGRLDARRLSIGAT